MCIKLILTRDREQLLAEIPSVNRHLMKFMTALALWTLALIVPTIDKDMALNNREFCIYLSPLIYRLVTDFFVINILSNALVESKKFWKSMNINL